MINKTIQPKKHGMTSEKASRVKTRGHKKEHIYAFLIDGEVVRGTRKEDVKDAKGKIHTLKGGGEIKGGEGRKGKWQLFLHKLSKFEQDTNFPGRKIFIKLLKSYPEKYQEYENNKKAIKEKIIPTMRKLNAYLNNKQNKHDFLSKACFDERVDYFVIYHDDSFYVFDKNEVTNIFTRVTEAENNSTFQKVVLKYEGVILAEIEIRTTNDGKYPSILFNMLKLKAFDLLSKETPKIKKITPNIFVCGKAANNFSLI